MKRAWYITYSEVHGNAHAVVLASNIASALSKWQKVSGAPTNAVTDIRELPTSVVAA